jgi:hypothetical protein
MEDEYDAVQDTADWSAKLLGKVYVFEDGDRIEVIQVKRRDTGPWITYNVYQGPGIPFNTNLYCVGSTINASGVVVPIYYFWARNTNVISEYREKTLSDFVIANYISNPRGSGIHPSSLRGQGYGPD